ncbi:hypothetical protein EDC94DRAFT_585635 [Helicostylum pulchrum]|nr:hypothetical protein EDC94DRAFT_585635 [Helicostylum pulchrum]
MSFTLQIKPYTRIPKTITVPIGQMDEALDTFPQVYAVLWIAGKLYQANVETNTTADSGNSNKRRRDLSHVWYKTFFCHRKGEKEQLKAALGGKSGVARPVQKA